MSAFFPSFFFSCEGIECERDERGSQILLPSLGGEEFKRERLSPLKVLLTPSRFGGLRSFAGAAAFFFF
jgi:hypothetical protein